MKTLFYTLLGGVTAVVGFYLLAIIVMYMSFYMTQIQGMLLMVFIFGCFFGYAIIDTINQNDEFYNK